MLCLTKYTAEGPSSRYRIYQFEPFLAAAGIEIEVQSLHDEGYLARRFHGERTPAGYLIGRFVRRVAALCSARKYDLVFIQKELFPHFPGIFETILYRTGTKIVLDLDDAIFLFYEKSPSALKRSLLGKKLPRVISKCSLVLAGNRYLESYARAFNENVVLFPTVVDTDRFLPANGPRSDRPPVVGWIGSPETVPYLKDVSPALERVSREVGFSFSLVGAEGIALNGVPVEAKPWSEDEEVADLGKFDVGIMPLPDTEWSRGKCSLKLLQYMSSAVPAVSSRVGSALDVINDGENGYLAGGRDEWAGRLAALLKDENLRKRIGQNGRLWVVANYSLANYGPRLVRFLRAAVEGTSVENA